MNQLLKKMKYVKPLYNKNVHHMPIHHMPMPMPILVPMPPSPPPPKKPSTDNIKPIINIRDLYKIKKHSLIEIKEYKYSKACALISACPAALFWTISYQMCNMVYFNYSNLLNI